MIIIDSNVWIFAEDDNADEHAIAARKVQEAVTAVGFAIDPIIVSEVFHALSRLLGSADASRRLVHIVDLPAARWLDCRPATVLRAIALAAQVKIRINDALIAQQSLERKASVLTDNVRDFERVRGLKVLPLR